MVIAQDEEGMSECRHRAIGKVAMTFRWREVFAQIVPLDARKRDRNVGNPLPSINFFHARKTRVRTRRACGAGCRAGCRAGMQKTNSAFFTVFFAYVSAMDAMHASSLPDVDAATAAIVGATDVKLHKKTCVRVVDSKKNRD